MLTAVNILGDSLPTDWSIVKRNWPHLKGVPFPQMSTYKPHFNMLIGTDLPYFHKCLKEISGKINEPVAKLTPLGWTAIGPTSYKVINSQLRLNFCSCKNLENLVKAAWELDTVGIKNNEKLENKANEEDLKAVHILKNEIKFNKNRYEVPILWKDEDYKFPNNYDKVYSRTKNLERSLMRKPEILNEYNKNIADYFSKGYISEISKDKVYEEYAFYIPHFPVVKVDRSTTKVRIVFDCAAKYNDKSLNDNILCGPKLQNDIVAVLIRFRRYKYALMGDISEMYLQISLNENYRKFCRFMWKDKVYQWNRLVFGRAVAPFIALYVVKEHAKKYELKFKEAYNSIINSMYVDDLADSRDTKEEIEDLINSLGIIFQEAGMQMRKWLTNSRKVMANISPELRAGKVKDVSDDMLPLTKTLGVSWDSNSDKLFYFSNCKHQENWSKRKV